MTNEEILREAIKHGIKILLMNAQSCKDTGTAYVCNILAKSFSEVLADTKDTVNTGGESKGVCYTCGRLPPKEQDDETRALMQEGLIAVLTLQVTAKLEPMSIAKLKDVQDRMLIWMGGK